MQIAKATDASSDCIGFGSVPDVPAPCVYWYGEVCQDSHESQAAIRMMKPGDNQVPCAKRSVFRPFQALKKAYSGLFWTYFHVQRSR